VKRKGLLGIDLPLARSSPAINRDKISGKEFVDDPDADVSENFLSAIRIKKGRFHGWTFSEFPRSFLQPW
jgi:hypothetical protein